MLAQKSCRWTAAVLALGCLALPTMVFLKPSFSANFLFHIFLSTFSQYFLQCFCQAWLHSNHDLKIVVHSFTEAMGDLLNDTKRFEAAFFVLKKTAANEAAKIPGVPFYVCSLCSRVVNYKGMLTCPGLLRSFPDLQEDDSEVTLVHSRFSTNSFSA